MANSEPNHGVFRRDIDGVSVKAVAYSPAEAVQYAGNGWEPILPFTSVNEPPKATAKAADGESDKPTTRSK